METKSLSIADIRIDGGTQPRAAISEATVKDYAAYVESGVALPPPDVFYDGTTYWLADGFHRFFAAKWLERTSITAAIHTGTRREAVLFSVGANHGHGLQRTHADKRKAVTTLMSDAEWSVWSNKEIARRCGVNASLVDDMRKASLPLNGSEEPKPTPRTFTTKHGTEATMHVEKIGKTSRLLPDRRPSAIAGRIEKMREMAEQGYSSRQIAAKLEISESGCRVSMRKAGIDVPADRAVGKSKHHDSDRIVEQMVMDAENLTADVNLIDFSSLDRDRLGEWADSLVASKKALDSFIRRLVKEQQKNGQAA